MWDKTKCEPLLSQDRFLTDLEKAADGRGGVTQGERSMEQGVAPAHSLRPGRELIRRKQRWWPMRDLFGETGPFHDPGGKVKTALPLGLRGDAEFSPCQRYRWLLRRWVGDAFPERYWLLIA
jgi:hypothetical protein